MRWRAGGSPFEGCLDCCKQGGQTLTSQENETMAKCAEKRCTAGSRCQWQYEGGVGECYQELSGALQSIAARGSNV
jgi:hypothetical protein